MEHVQAPLRPDRRADHKWLETRAHEYPGEWLLMYQGELLFHGKLDWVLGQVGEHPDKPRMLLHFQPAAEEEQAELLGEE